MAVCKVSMLFLFSLVITTVVCQTFQYSHGWTNGKRSRTPGLVAVAPEFKARSLYSQNADSELSSIWVQCELRKLKMLSQDNGNEELYLLPCELLDSPKKNILKNVRVNQLQEDH